MLIQHFDFNSAAFRPEFLRQWIKETADAGFDTILWEIENKVRWETCPECAHPDAMTKEEFRSLLRYAASLGLGAIPLLQTAGHAEYVLKNATYFKFRENPERNDCYCTSQPDVREFLRAWLKEYLDLFGDVRFFHLGGDEAHCFGTCPVCSKRDFMELYNEHLSFVAAPLFEKNITPVIWGDMLLNHLNRADQLDKRFLVADWRYFDNFDTIPGWARHEPGDKPFQTTQKLADAGFRSMLASSSAVIGDCCFIPNWDLHAENIAAAAVYAAKHGLHYCVTSWSVNIIPKFLQLPLWQLGAKVYHDPDHARDLIHSARETFFGSKTPDAVITALGEWNHWSLPKAGTAVIWNGVKDSASAPAGFLQNRIDEVCRKADDPAAKRRELAAIYEQQADSSEDALDLLEYRRGTDERFDRYLHGAELRVRYLRILTEILAEEAITTDNLYLAKKLRDEIKRYLFDGGETLLSAECNAGLTADPLVDYLQTALAGKE